MKSFLSTFYNIVRQKDLSLATLLKEIEYMPISWRKELIGICQTGVRIGLRLCYGYFY